MQSGDIEAAKKYLAMVKYPNLLFKPVRQGYYMIQSNLSMMNKDYAGAEAHLKESLKIRRIILVKNMKALHTYS
jgi:hypothetical protein